MRHSRAGRGSCSVELDGAPEVRLGSAPVPLRVQLGERERRITVRQRRVELDGPVAARWTFRKSSFGAPAPNSPWK